MIYNLQTAKRLLKRAYKAGTLVVGMTEEGWFYTGGGFWILCQDIETTPKEYKAAVLGLTGALPERNEVFRSGKYGNQYEIPQTEIYVLPVAFGDIDGTGLSFTRTTVCLDWKSTQVNLYKNDSTQVGMVIAGDLDILPDKDDGNLDAEKGETPIEGPLKPADRELLIWHNNTTWIAALPISIKENNSEEAETWREEFMAVARAFNLMKIGDMEVKF